MASVSISTSTPSQRLPRWVTQSTRLAVIVPVFNEESTIERILEAVQKAPLEKEIIVVDDASTDGTSAALQRIAANTTNLIVLRHPVNRGKGAAVRTGIAAATAPLVVVQDADLEYDPAELPSLVRPIREGKADVVFGSRFLGGNGHRVPRYWHSQGNRLLTLLSNMLTNLKLNDMETCYKVIPREVLLELDLREHRFGIEPEIAAKLARYRTAGHPLRIAEVGITYHARRWDEGKKIGWRDGFRALWCILKYNLWHR